MNIVARRTAPVLVSLVVAGFLALLLTGKIQFLRAGYSFDNQQAEYNATAAHPPMHIYAIDVGQGDSALIVFPDGMNMLIDAGPRSGGTAVAALLNRLGISKLNIVVITHSDSDHSGGLSRLTGYIDGNTRLYDNYYMKNVSPGQIIHSGEEFVARCVATGGKIVGGADFGYVGDNDGSVVLLVTYRGFDYLTGGDVGGSVEDAIGDAMNNFGENIDVLKVSHHGSKYSTSLYFLQRIMPERAIIMVGNNPYGHPTQETLNRLNDSSIHVNRIFQTEQGRGGTAANVTVANGQIVITTNGAFYAFANEGDGSTPFSYGPYPVDEYVTPDEPHLMITEAAIDGSFLSPENHRWIELYLPPGASSVDMSKLYWVSSDKKGRLAKNGSLTMQPDSVAIVHMTAATDTGHIDDNDNTGPSGNGWWNTYTRLDGDYWYKTDDCLMVSMEDSLQPNPLNIYDAVVWSDLDGYMNNNVITKGNFLINCFHWGNPISGSGGFTSLDASAAIGDIRTGYVQRRTTLDTDSKADWKISPTHSQGTPPPTPTPIPTKPPPPPSFEINVNSNNPSAGQRFTVSAVVQSLRNRSFDGYAVIIAPTGRIYSIQRGNRLVPGVVPIVRGVRALPRGYAGRLLDMELPSGIEGNYRVIGGLVDAGSRVRGAGSAFWHDMEYVSVK